ncbi:MAG: flavin reductase family protein [Acidimicrobiia bacterium]|nr:flavin reductase family protein [Acidimicrobiia bacterium]
MATFRVSEMAPVDGYKLATGLVVPRPIGWIGSVSETGVFNLAPFSFFNAIGAAPPCVVVSPLTREGHPKDTLANLRHTGEFTHNVVTREVIEAVNMTAATLDHDVDEFAHAGLTAIPSDTIGAPRVGEAKASFECVVLDIIPVGTGPMSANLVIGEIKVFHVDDDLLDGTRIDQTKLQAVGRMAGADYATTSDMFSLQRPS